MLRASLNFCVINLYKRARIKRVTLITITINSTRAIFQLDWASVDLTTVVLEDESIDKFFATVGVVNGFYAFAASVVFAVTFGKTVVFVVAASIAASRVNNRNSTFMK